MMVKDSGALDSEAVNMKKSDLRVGNVYWSVSGKDWTMKTWTLRDFSRRLTEKDKPVRLKERVLNGAGFIYEKHVTLELWHSPNGYYSLCKNIHNEFYIFNLCIQQMDMKYMHELQNLHYSIYREELKIKQ